MTITEFQIQLDLDKGNEESILEKHASLTGFGYFFVDSKDGTCYLFGKNGKLDDINKLNVIYKEYVKEDIKKIVIPNSVESIGDYAFFNCKSLTSIEISESVKSIGYGAFRNCTYLKSIEIPKSVENIGDDAFWNCSSLTSIEISESVKRIGDGAFFNCKSLTSIEISESVKSIGYGAFKYCNSLTSLLFKGKKIGQVKEMDDYPWGIEDLSIIRCEK